MRRTAVRRPTRLTESKLRQIIRSVINESGESSFDDMIRYPKPGQVQELTDACMNANDMELREFFKSLIEHLSDPSGGRGPWSDEFVAKDDTKDEIRHLVSRLIGVQQF